MISVRCYRGDGDEETARADDISELVKTDGVLLWVDLVEPTDADFDCIQREFDLHPLAMEDAIKHAQRPKLERYPAHAFIVAYSCQLAEVDAFVGPTWVVTVRADGPDGEPWDLEPARKRFERTKAFDTTAGFLLYTLLDELVDGYFTRTDANEDRIELLEERIFRESADNELLIQQDLFGIRRDLLEFRRRVVPLREVVQALLRGDLEWIDDRAQVHMQDVYDHVLRAQDLIDSQRELVGNAVDAHLAIISNRMNQVMKTMTSWGAILLGSTLVAGIYGMNFQHMPELGWRYGYLFALGLMAAVTGLGYWFFKRRDWL